MGEASVERKSHADGVAGSCLLGGERREQATHDAPTAAGEDALGVLVSASRP